MILIFCAMAVIIILLIIRISLLKKSAREIMSSFREKLEEDTNTQIRISSRDRDMRALADDINTQLRTLRREQLRYQQGNTELKTAITNISHDIRTPLTAIYGYLDMMKKTEDPDKQARYIDIMKERADMMKHLTEELFRYSIIVSEETEMETEKVYINQLLAESISSFYPALKAKGIEPVINLTDKRIEREVNKAALSRVFSNLLNNAVKYSGGDLEVALSEDCVISFSNTAKGLSAVEVEQLFDRFYTVEAAHHSTGLGLPIARTLAERMGGTLTAEYKDERLIIRLSL